jgi:hypothetical protein
MVFASDELHMPVREWAGRSPDRKISGLHYSLIRFGTNTHTFCHVQALLVY